MQVAPWLQDEIESNVPRVTNAPPRVSSLRPSSTVPLTAAEQVLAQMEQMNQTLRNNPQAVTSVHAATASTTAIEEQESEQLQAEFYKSVASNCLEDKTYLAKIEALMRAKVRTGVPDNVRAEVWKTLALSDAPLFPESRFKTLLESDPRGFDKIIRQDIHRTFPEHPHFSVDEGPGQTSLYNILKAYAVFDSDCGYCQGLSFLVAPLLMQPGMSDLDAFRIFIRLMDENANSTSGKRFALRSLFTPEMPGLHLILHQHSELVRAYLPQLHAKLARQGITPSTYASPWFLTLFTYTFPLPLVFRIYDLILSEGATLTMLKISLALLRRNESVLMEMADEDFEGALELLKRGSRLLEAFGEDVCGTLVRDVGLLDSAVTESVLTKFTTSYFENKQISTTSALEIQTLRAKVDFMSMQNDTLFRENANLKLALAKINKERLEDLADVRRECDERVERALAVAEEERVRRVAVERELEQLLKSRRLESVATVQG